jgi:hypothetical protein
MKFYVDARFTPGADPAPSMPAEIKRVGELVDEGFIELLWKRIDNTGAYLVVSADDEAAARAQLDTLPFVAEGTMSIAIDEVEQLYGVGA